MKSIALLLALAGFAAAAVANPPAAPAAAASAPAVTSAPSGHPVGTVDMGNATAPLTKKGKVLAVVEAKSFTYINIQDGKNNLWVVSPIIAVKKGDMISYADAKIQKKYHSTSLNRDFKDIIFTTRAVVEK